METDITGYKIKQILRERGCAEDVTIDSLEEMVPKASEVIIQQLFNLITQEGTNLPISLTPEISLNYYDSEVYLRIIEKSSANFLNNNADRKKLFPSISLKELFKDVDENAFLKGSIRKHICNLLAKKLEKDLKFQGIRTKRIKSTDPYETPSEITISVTI